MKKLFFLAGLPRSGSTLLAAILNQRPDTYVSPTSGLIDLLGSNVHVWENNPAMNVQDKTPEDLMPLLRNVIDGHYSKIKHDMIIDKARGWPNPQIMKTMSKVLGEEVKIIATVRSVPDCAASFVRIAKPENVKDFLNNSHLIDHLKASYITLLEGYEANPKNIHFVDYDDLMSDPTAELRKVERFLGLLTAPYHLDNIMSHEVEEKDEEIWGIKNLHMVAPVLNRQHNEDSRDILGSKYSEFDQPKFWKGEKEKEPQLIDKLLEASQRGDFEEGWRISEELEQTDPENNRAAYNRGWYLLSRGELIEGHKYLDRGREEGVFGNKPPTAAPLWNKEEDKVVLLNLEGGLGDQIWGVRFAKKIAALNNKVIVACSPELGMIFKDVKGISAIVAHGSAHAVYHDCWLPSFSAPPLFYSSYERIHADEDEYIKNDGIVTEKIRIGLRWQGNPRFENEQKRVFPPELLFDAVKNENVEFISLQRDIGTEHKPDWVKEVDLSTWEKTRQAIESCDLVISSCTSVAHLSSAMDVPTLIISPILPYFLWAKLDSGDYSYWYGFTKIIKQTKPDSWIEPFQEVNTYLKDHYECYTSK